MMKNAIQMRAELAKLLGGAGVQMNDTIALGKINLSVNATLNHGGQGILWLLLRHLERIEALEAEVAALRGGKAKAAPARQSSDPPAPLPVIDLGG